MCLGGFLGPLFVAGPSDSPPTCGAPFSGAHNVMTLYRQQQNVAQLLQVRQALAQQHAPQVAAQQAKIPKRIEAEATSQAAELVKVEHENQKQKKPKTRTQQSKMSTTQPHEARRMDGRRVLGNGKSLQKPTLKSTRWEVSVRNSGRPSKFLRPGPI